MNEDMQLLEKAQKLIDRFASRTAGLDLRAVEVVRDAEIVRVLISHAQGAQIEDYVHVLASVEAELDVEDGMTLILVPVADEAA